VLDREAACGSRLKGFSFINTGHHVPERRKVIESKQVIALYGFSYRQVKVGSRSGIASRITGKPEIFFTAEDAAK
jgi:hypothetical protein